MNFNFENLDQETREYMIQEVSADISSGNLYRSPRLSPSGWQTYPEALRMAASEGNEQSFAAMLATPGTLNSTETRRKPNGGVTEAKIPATAPATLAEGEFNRFYMRAVCRRALESGQENVTVYRAKEVSNARSQSLQLIGRTLDARQLLNDLRTNVGTDTALGLPPGPNSGLSVRI